MERIMFDTSVYGKLVQEDIVRREFEKKFERKEYIMYGNSVIRTELRSTPKNITFKNKKLQILLLTLYDSFIKKNNHDLKINPLIEKLSKDYFEEYKKQGGNLSNEELKNDLIIIAIATIYQLDIVISSDENTMLSPICITTYKTINRGYGLGDPKFKLYSVFKKELL